MKEKAGGLWNGHWAAGKSQSEADLALCAKIAFWTGANIDMIDRLFSLSVLGQRPKWERKDYSSRTITLAVERVSRECRSNPLFNLNRFLNSSCRFIRTSRVGVRDLFFAYLRFCRERGLPTLGKKTFSYYLKKNWGMSTRRGAKGKWIWESIQMLPSAIDVLE